MVKDRIPALLRGSAQLWYSTGIDQLTKTGLRHSDINEWYTQLRDAFKRPLSESLSALQKMKYSLQDARNRKPIAQFIYGITKHARDAGFNEARPQLTYAFNGIELLLRQGIMEPTEGTSIAMYVKMLEQHRDTWAAVAEHHLRGPKRDTRTDLPYNNSKLPRPTNGQYSSRGFNGNRRFPFTPSQYNYNRPYPNTQQQQFQTVGPYQGGGQLYQATARPALLPTSGNCLAIEGSQSKNEAQGPNNAPKPYANKQYGNPGYRQPNRFTPNAQYHSNWVENGDGSTEEMETETYWSNLYHNDPEQYQREAEAYMAKDNEEEEATDNAHVEELPTTVENYHIDQEPAQPKCSICKKTFSSKNRLHQHLVTDHGKSAKN